MECCITTGGPIPGFEPRKKENWEEENSEEKKNNWVIHISLLMFGFMIVLGTILIIGDAGTPDSYPKYIRECFSHLTTLDHSLSQENDVNGLVKEIKKDIIKNHLVPLCGFTYENMDHKMISIFFPNVLFDPIGIK